MQDVFKLVFLLLKWSELHFYWEAKEETVSFFLFYIQYLCNQHWTGIWQDLIEPEARLAFKINNRKWGQLNLPHLSLLLKHCHLQPTQLHQISDQEKRKSGNCYTVDSKKPVGFFSMLCKDKATIVLLTGHTIFIPQQWWYYFKVTVVIATALTLAGVALQWCRHKKFNNKIEEVSKKFNGCIK